MSSVSNCDMRVLLHPYYTHTHTVEQVSYVLCNIVIDQPGEHEQDMLIFD